VWCACDFTLTLVGRKKEKKNWEGTKKKKKRQEEKNKNVKYRTKKTEKHLSPCLT
jgi:hypothetical protein